MSQLDRIKSLTEEIEEHRAAMHDLASRRRQAILSLLSPELGYGGIAKLLGLSRARVQQMANEGRRTDDDAT